MPKNIVVCADGTGNTTVKGRGTNVFKLYEAVDENGHRFFPHPVQQVAIYHDGVGTEQYKWVRLFSGAFGWGLSRNVKQLYGEVARVYDPGDRIYLFGFSRGAFTVRTLAGLITTCGILDVTRFGSNSALRRAIRTAYNEYRRKYQTIFSKWFHGERKLDAAELRHRFSVPIPGFSDPGGPVVHFVGVWDTVDAVGLPIGLADFINTFFWRFKFSDTSLSPHVGYACHALALDEARQSFAPVLWDEREEDPPRPRIEQVWFAGVHSNVGGGYPHQGMSLVALDWMMAKAEEHGLRFRREERVLYQGTADVNDKGYDSRSGLGVLYRWKPRDVTALCGACGVLPKLHRTIFERVARNTNGYAPGTVPPRCEVISTTASPEARASVKRTLERAFGGGPPLLEQVSRFRAVGTTGYWLLIATLVSLVGVMLWTYVQDARAHAVGRREMLANLANTAISSHWLQIALRTLLHHPWLAISMVVSLALLLWAERRLDSFYSAFWHTVRRDLRDAL
jgi:uncharacterized protein (DUF2235 family)